MDKNTKTTDSLAVYSASAGPLSDSEILDWLDENTKEDGYPIEGWMQDMGYGNFDTLREWAIHEIENVEGIYK
tara:strand:+ start:58 stop:276 length:219 start_codon:yes stop_codon:yes gene_type:complete